MSSEGVSVVDRKFMQFPCDDEIDFKGLNDVSLDPVDVTSEDFFDTDDLWKNQMGLDLPADPRTMLNQYNLSDYDFSDLFQADQQLSDSSDSGVNLAGSSTEIKHEIISNPSTPSSDCGSEGYISGQDAFINAVLNDENKGTISLSEPMYLSEPGPGLPPAFSEAIPSMSSSSLPPSTLSPTSPVEDTLILIPQEEGGDQLMKSLKLPQLSASVVVPKSAVGPCIVASPSPAVLTSTSFSSPSPVPIQLNSILNQKVQILPKPNTSVSMTGKKTSSRLPAASVAVSGTATANMTPSPVVPKVELKPVPVKPGGAKKLVLTAEEFAKMTASGTLRFQPPNSDLHAITTAANVPSTSPPHLSSVVTSLSDMVSNDFCGLDNAKSKRQQRMIKNRESASLSRKRKKEYLTSLEDRVKEFTEENQKLRNENTVLKTKLQQLHDENVQLRQSTGITTHKKTLLLITALLFSFNLSSISSLLPWDRSLSNSDHQAWNSPPLAVRGRHLLSLPDNSPSAAFDSGSGGKSDSGPERLWRSEHARQMIQFDEDLQLLLTRGKLNESIVAAHFCPIYFNSTESSRLAEQLRGWMIREEEVKKKKQTPKPRAAPRKKAYPTVNTLKAAMQGHYAQNLRDSAYRSGGEQKRHTYQMQVFQHNDPRQRLLNAIPRRNDTFYVLSFNTDYFLVPATAHNKTARPRMSLVMPVVSETLNDTMQPPEGSVGMMQIDCEILNTQLIHIRKSVFPQQSGEAYSSQYSNQTADTPHQRFHTNRSASTNNSSVPEVNDELDPTSNRSTFSRRPKLRSRRNK